MATMSIASALVMPFSISTRAISWDGTRLGMWKCVSELWSLTYSRRFRPQKPRLDGRCGEPTTPHQPNTLDRWRLLTVTWRKLASPKHVWKNSCAKSTLFSNPADLAQRSTQHDIAKMPGLSSGTSQSCGHLSRARLLKSLTSTSRFI